MAGLLGFLLPCHPLLLNRVRFMANYVTGLAHNSHCHLDIRPQTHLAKQPHEDVKRPLEPVRLCRRNEANFFYK